MELLPRICVRVFKLARPHQTATRAGEEKKNETPKICVNKKNMLSIFK